ncbi:lipopolysaccharide transport system permease protein [Pseudomonas nitroreducens]|nr:lipopolysaccharide transport system permease protein [Pseudomonas nitroreducens]MCP1685965.1 lipopolysaccharide transport system permease protein [Pseudomonas nitroreducens]
MPNHFAPTRAERLIERSGLMFTLARRELDSRYRGTLLGRLWVVLSPFLMLAVYTFVFGHILKSRWGTDQSTASFSLTLFSGLLLNTLMGECLGRAAGVIHDHGNYVKKLVFPLEIIPLSLVVAGLTNVLVGYLILLLAMFLLGHTPGWIALLLPLVLLPFLLCIIGLTCLIAALGAYFRDTQQLVQFALVLALFLSPVLYPLASLPEGARAFLSLNPLTIPVQAVRGLLFDAPLPSMIELAVYCAASLVIAIGGLWLFLRVKSGFIDVL